MFAAAVGYERAAGQLEVEARRNQQQVLYAASACVRGCDDPNSARKERVWFSRSDQEPLKDFNKGLCRTKKYGIGGHASNVDISGLCVVKSEPPVWFCDVAGQRVEPTTDDLQAPQRFQKACMEQIRRCHR